MERKIKHLGKTAHGLWVSSPKLTRMRVLHCEMELTFLVVSIRCFATTQPPKKENRTISGSPSGRPYPSFFPSKENIADNTTRVIARAKGDGWQKIQCRCKQCCCEERTCSSRRGNLLLMRRLLRGKVHRPRNDIHH